jgi:hypothetical protein
MSIARVPGYSLLSNLDRQGIDLEFSTNSQTLTYMDFANFRLGVNTSSPSQSLEVVGNVLVTNGHVYSSANISYDIGSTSNWFRTVYANSITSTSLTGTLLTANQPNITGVGTLVDLTVSGNIVAGNISAIGGIEINGNLTVDNLTANTYTGIVVTNNQPFITNLANITLTNLTSTANISTSWIEAIYANISNIYGTILTADQPYISNLGNISVDSITIGGNISITGNTNGGIINADELYENGFRVLTSDSNIVISGDVVGSGTYNNVAVSLLDVGVSTGSYGDSSLVTSIVVDSKGRITSAANVVLTRVGNITINDTTLSSTSNLVLLPSTGIIDAGNSRISNIAEPIDSADAVTKSYLESALIFAANVLAAGDSTVTLTDAGVANLAVILDGNLTSVQTPTTTTFYQAVTVGELTTDGDTISSTGNIVLDATGAGIVQIAGTDALGIPAGGIGTRPSAPMTGYTRFNTDTLVIETWDGNTWTSPGVTTVTSETITPDGISNTFTLTSNVSSAYGLLVSINGTLQQPVTAYDVNGNQLIFTEIPQDTDVVEVRSIAAGVVVSALQYGAAEVELSNGNVNIAGNLIPQANVTYDIGSEDLRWRDLYLSGDTIYLGGTPVSVSDGKLLVGNNIVSTIVPQLSWAAITIDESILPQISRFGIVAAGGGTFIAATDGFNDAVYSTDGGLTWTLFELPYTPASNLQMAKIHPFAYGNGIWLLAFGQTTQRQTATSTDGVNWTVHPEVLPNENPNAELDPLHEWMGVIFSDKFVMFSSGVRSVQNSGFPRIISSPDGINWTGHNPILGEFGIPVAPSIGYDGTGPWYMTGLAWGNGTYVGIGQGYNTVGGGIAGNQFYYSTTLNSWQQVIVPVSAEWRQIRFANGAFIAWGNFPSLAVRSTDNGLTWEEITLPPGILDIEYGQGRWIAITGNTFDNQGQHAYSLDNGTTWVAFDMPTVANLYGYSALAFNGTTFCAVGGGGGYFGGEVIAISTITTNAVEEVCCYADSDVFEYLPTHTGNISAGNINANSVFVGGESVASLISSANTAMKGYVDQQVTTVLNNAPEILDTLGEIANALGNDANLSTTLTNMIGNVQANVTTANTNMKGYVDNINSTLTANAAVQSGLIDNLTSNAAVQAGNIAIIQSTYAQLAGATFTGAIEATSLTLSTTPLAVSSGGTGSTSTSGALNNLLPSGEVSGYVLKTSGPGSYYWAEGGTGGSTVGSQISTSRTFFTANSGQTIFADVGTYTIGSGQLRVYIDGVRQFDSAYTETSNTSFTLSAGVSSGAIVLAEIDAYQDYTVYADDVVFSNLGGISATNVQDALAELDTEKASLSGATFTGNVSASYFIGDGSQLTGIVSGGSSNYGNANVAAYLPTHTGNISAANFIGNGSQLTGITATMVGLGNVTNESKATMFTSPTFTGTVSGITATMVGLGNVTNESKATMFTSPTFTGTVTLQQSVELFTSPSIVSNAVTLNFTNGAIFALGSNSANITANFTNIPGTAGRTISTTLIITQGATPYIPSAVTINGGGSATIRWQGGTVPTAVANRVNIVNFTFICTATNTWTVIGSLVDYN